MAGGFIRRGDRLGRPPCNDEMVTFFIENRMTLRVNPRTCSVIIIVLSFHCWGC
jgi:hypothetical protein